MLARAFTAFFLAIVLGGLVAAFANAQDPRTLFEVKTDRWSRQLDEIDLDSKAFDLSPKRFDELKQRLAAITAEAQAAQKSAAEQMLPLTTQLKAFGPKPAEGEAPESIEVARQRASLDSDLAAIRGQVQQAELVIAQANSLGRNLTARTQKKLLDHLQSRLPYPLSPSAWTNAAPELGWQLARLVRSPADWWDGLSEEERQDAIHWRMILIISFALLLGLVIRILVRRWFGRDPAVQEPSYARRFSAAVAEAVATGIVPALIFGAFLYRVTSESALISGLFATAVAAFCGGMIFVILAWALPRAALSPDTPNWRLISIAPENANRICTLITCLVAVGVIDAFFAVTVGGSNELGRLTSWSLDLQSVYSFVVIVARAGLILALMRESLWHGGDSVAQPDDQDAEGAADEGTAQSSWLWRAGGRAASLLAVVSIAASLFGYVYVGLHITRSLLWVGIITGVILLVRGVLRELIGVALRSRFLQISLRVRHPTRRVLKFWFRLALDVVAIGIWVFLTLPLVGIPDADVFYWTSKALTGLTFGSITISITDIALGLLAFLLVVLATRMLQRVLEDQVLPQTRLDIGVRNSVKAGIGYLGITIAALIAISVVGLDLSNLAIIAGALSVGIGFGLQTIVNNFVSGLILLVERPVKAGDWIMTGGHEGFVKRINVRATEIETFQRASVIIPNSELLSSALINWTHKDHYGRVEIDVGVAYGSDVDQVMKILQDCLDQHAKILSVPESSVIFMSFGESSLDFQARGFIANVLYRPFVASELRVAIYRAFAEAGIEIPFPQRDLHLKDIDQLRKGLAGRAARAEGAAAQDESAGRDQQDQPDTTI